MALLEKFAQPRMKIDLQGKQEFYNNGDTIRGKIVLLDVDAAAKARIEYLRVELVLEECVDIGPVGMEKSTSLTGKIETEDVEEVFKASRCEFAFKVIVPEVRRFPSVCLDHVGARDCGLIWRVRAELAWRHCETLSKLNCASNVTVYPIIPFKKPYRFYHGTKSYKDVEVRLKIPEALPQGPELCDITVVLKPKKPLRIEKVQVLLRRKITMSNDEAARVFMEDFVFETVQVGKVCSSDIELNGIRRGWRLERVVSPECNAININCTYSLLVAIWAPHRMSMQSLPFHVCSPVSSSVEDQPPSYSQSLCRKAALEF